MKIKIAHFAISSLLIIFFSINSLVAVSAVPDNVAGKSDTTVAAAESVAPDMADDVADDGGDDAEFMELMADSTPGFQKVLKTKFIEGNALFMSFVALALVIGLAFCIERIIFLSLSEINVRRFMNDLDKKIASGKIDDAKKQCRDTRGPVASICYQGLLRIDESLENIEKSVESYGAVQIAALEKGCSWITMLIAIAPSLGFLGTVIGIVMSFGQIQAAGDISPTIVASGMKVALITTIFGIIVAVILQLFNNYINSRIDNLTAQMQESSITLIDSIVKYKHTK